MKQTDLLLMRLEEIGVALSQKENALALLGLGSVGVETNRLDEYSDIDFFVIVKESSKEEFLNNTDWLESTVRLGYIFKNTKDGFKIMYEDGVYGECAIFEEHEMDKIDYSEGRIVWKANGFRDTNISVPKKPFTQKLATSIDFNVNEALTNLYVGLCRYKRGELLSATRFIQSYAVDGLIQVLHLLEESKNGQKDKFNHDRRIEQRYPEFSQNLPDFIQGYNGIKESAVKILEFMEKIYDVNETMAREIRKLAR